MQQRSRLERMRDRLGGANREVAEKLRDYGLRAKELEQASASLDEVLERAYRDPGAARRGIERSLKRDVAGKTVETLRQRPAVFGKVHGRALSRERAEARQVAQVEVRRALRDYDRARFVERQSLRRLAEHRRNPEQSILGAAKRARGILTRASLTFVPHSLARCFPT